ncbi:exported hypothetical protein [Vibrio chagasii]|nr:exported hypothetical protein [Vibrio chagasii]
MRNFLKVAAFAVSGVAIATPLTLSDFETGVVAEHKTELPAEFIETLPYRGKLVSDSMSVFNSERLVAAHGYVESQTYLPEYIRNALSHFATVYEYLIQNAHDEKALTEAVKHVVNSDVCLYFSYDDTSRFVQDRVIRTLTSDEDSKSRLLNAASFVIDSEETKLQQDQDGMKMMILHCSEFVKSFQLEPV